MAGALAATLDYGSALNMEACAGMVKAGAWDVNGCVPALLCQTCTQKKKETHLLKTVFGLLLYLAEVKLVQQCFLSVCLMLVTELKLCT